jgi:hypothetical protein
MTYVERTEDQTRELVRPPVAVPAVLTVTRWFDRKNGNSYFSGRLVLTVAGEIRPVPFQYGRDLSDYVRAADAVSDVSLADPDVRLIVHALDVSTMRECKRFGSGLI